MKALGLDMDVSQMTGGMAFRIEEKGDCAEITEFFGGDKKTYCVKYDTEFDYERPGKIVAVLLFLLSKMIHI